MKKQTLHRWIPLELAVGDSRTDDFEERNGEQMKRRHSGLCVILSVIVLCTALCVPAFAWDEEAQAIYDYAVKYGKKFVYGWNEEAQALYDDVVEHGEKLTPSDKEAYDDQIARADPYREKTKSFSHGLVIGGYWQADLDVDVTGIYSQADNEAEITDVNGTISGNGGEAYFEAYSYIRNGCGYLSVSYRGEVYAVYTYSIASNGYISEDARYNYDIMRKV